MVRLPKIETKKFTNKDSPLFLFILYDVMSMISIQIVFFKSIYDSMNTDGSGSVSVDELEATLEAYE